MPVAEMYCTIHYNKNVWSRTRLKTGTESHDSSLPPRSHGMPLAGPSDRTVASYRAGII